MSFSFTVQGHSEASAKEVAAAASKAFAALSKVGASQGSLSGNTAGGEPFSVAYPASAAPGASMTNPAEDAAKA